MTQRERDATRLDVFGDPLPELALSRCGTVRMWHPPDRNGLCRDVRAAAFSPDARRLVTAAGRAARVWDLEDGREVAVLPSQWGEVRAVLYLSATRILTAGEDRTLRLWDVERGAVLRQWSLECLGLHRLALSPDGRTLLVGTSEPSGFAVFDMSTGEQRQWVQPEDSVGYPGALSFSPDGSQVLLLEEFFEDIRLCVFDSATWALQWATGRGCLSTWNGWASFSPDGRQVRYPDHVSSWRYGVYQHDARTGALLDIASYRYGGMWLPLPDGREARIREHRLIIFRDGEPERWVNLPASCFRTKVEPVVAPGGRWAAFAGSSSAVVLVDLDAGKVRPERAHRHEVSGLTFSRDGTKLLTYARDETLRTWERGSGRQVARVTLERWSRDLHLRAGRVLQVGGCGGTGMLIRDLLGGAEVNIKVRGRRSTVWSDDYSVVATLANHGVEGELTVHIHDARTGTRLRRMPIATEDKPACALSRTGRLLVTSAWKGEPAPGHMELRLWNLERRGPPRLVLPIPVGERMTQSSTPTAGFSPDDAWLVYLDARGAAVLVDLACPERRIRLGAGAPIATFRFSEDGKLLATGDCTGGVKVWSLEGRLLGTLDGHRAYVSALAFSADGDFLASASTDTTALIWPRSAWER
ncbi:WD40 repeat domain-containing protein [Pyxidicoccus sp. 3LG]